MIPEHKGNLDSEAKIKAYYVFFFGTLFKKTVEELDAQSESVRVQGLGSANSSTQTAKLWSNHLMNNLNRDRFYQEVVDETEKNYPVRNFSFIV
jgi:hypothetical protein